MASDQVLRVVLTALDKTAEVFREARARTEALSAPIRHVGDRLAALGEETGLIRIGEHARNALEHVRHLGEGKVAASDELLLPKRFPTGERK